MLNAIAGGGSFLTFPALVFTGVPPIVANATSTMALWPGSLASVGAYRKDVRAYRSYLVPFSIASLIVAEASLSFLGLGIQPPLPSWGNMLTNAQELIWQAPALAIYPGLLIFVTVIALTSAPAVSVPSR